MEGMTDVWAPNAEFVRDMMR